MNQPLQDWRVLVPRAKHQAASMIQALHDQGAIPIAIPTLEITPNTSSEFDAVIAQINTYDWLILTSRNAVDSVCAAARRVGVGVKVPVAVVGKQTALAARDQGLRVEYQCPPGNENAQTLVEEFPGRGRALFAKANIAPDTVMGLRNCAVDAVEAYTTSCPAPDETLAQQLRSGYFDAICFSSGSSVRNLLAMGDQPHERTMIAVIGKKTKQVAQACGLRVDVMPQTTDAVAMVQALAESAC